MAENTRIKSGLVAGICKLFGADTTRTSIVSARHDDHKSRFHNEDDPVLEDFLAITSYDTVKVATALGNIEVEGSTSFRGIPIATTPQTAIEDLSLQWRSLEKYADANPEAADELAENLYLKAAYYKDEYSLEDPADNEADTQFVLKNTVNQAFEAARDITGDLRSVQISNNGGSFVAKRSVTSKR